MRQIVGVGASSQKFTSFPRIFVKYFGLKKMGRCRTCFVTVGSTEFDDLISAVLSKTCREALKSLGFDKIILQYGSGSAIDEYLPDDVKHIDAASVGCGDGITVDYFRYKPSIQNEMETSDLIIGHAGAGTILEAMRLKKPMIAVINEKLMDNHQIELAEKLAELGHLIKTVPSELASAILDKKLFSPKLFQQSSDGKFADYLYKKLGFVEK